MIYILLTYEEFTEPNPETVIHQQAFDRIF